MFNIFGNLLMKKGEKLSLSTLPSGLGIDTVRVTDCDMVIRDFKDELGDVVETSKGTKKRVKSNIRGVECTIKHSAITLPSPASILIFGEDFGLDENVTLLFLQECTITYGTTT